MPTTSHKKTFIVFSLTTLICICFYLLSRSTQLTWANYGNDSGDFLAALLTVGVPHPTGYPTYMLLGFLLQHLPIGDFYFRAVLISLLPTAMSAGIMSIIAKRYLFRSELYINYVFSFFTALIWGLAPFLWSQALIVEVQGLQSLFIVGAIWWCFYLFQSPPQRYSFWKLGLFAFIFALGLGNHLTLLLFLPAILVGIVYAYQNALSLKMIFVQVLMASMALLVYLYLPLRAGRFPAINWGNASTWDGFWWLISGQAYHHLLFDLTFSQFFNRISALAAILRNQFGAIGIILAVVGIIWDKFSNRNVKFLLLYLFFIYALFAIFYGTDDSIVYLLPTFAVVALWIGSSLPALLEIRIRNYALGKWALIGCALLFIATIPITWRNVNPRGDTQAADYAEMTLHKLPQNAILLTSADPDSFPLWYYHFGLQQRPDLTIVVLPLTQFRWYQETLIQVYPQRMFPTLIQAFSNYSQSWGEQVAEYNPDHVICRSAINRADVRTIQISCTDQTEFSFTIRSQ